MSEPVPPTDANFRIEPAGNIIVRDLDACTDQQREYFFESLENRLWTLWLKSQSGGQN
jgi:hypothetical protein